MVHAPARYTPPVRVLDLSDNPRIKVIEELLVEEISIDGMCGVY